jgi:hypothetical protein
MGLIRSSNCGMGVLGLLLRHVCECDGMLRCWFLGSSAVEWHAVGTGLTRAPAADSATGQEMAERSAALGQEIVHRQGGRARPRPARAAGPAAGAAPGTTPPPPTPQPKPRVLVDPSTLTVANADGTPGERSGSGRPTGRSGTGSSPLPPPNRNAGAPRSRAAAAGFTPHDKESVGLELARLVLGRDAEGLVDLRAQHGVGADAIDSLDRFFELKVHLGDEPDTIHLEASHIRRALSTPNFFLVVVSNVEGANARPKVRIIIDPIHQLTITQSSSVSYTGVRSAEHSLVYELGPISEEEASP